MGFIKSKNTEKAAFFDFLHRKTPFNVFCVAFNVAFKAAFARVCGYNKANCFPYCRTPIPAPDRKRIRKNGRGIRTLPLPDIHSFLAFLRSSLNILS